LSRVDLAGSYLSLKDSAKSARWHVHFDATARCTAAREALYLRRDCVAPPIIHAAAALAFSQPSPKL
jgi:hypothetical protein